MKIIWTLILVLVGTSIFSFAQEPEEQIISKTLADFENAMVENDTESASSLLHDDVIIMEGNGTETKEEYLSHHFHSDGRFLSAMNRELISEKITIDGNIAWVSTITSMKGTFSERDIDLTSLELAVLKKESGHWKIIALHWSSR